MFSRRAACERFQFASFSAWRINSFSACSAAIADTSLRERFPGVTASHWGAACVSSARALLTAAPEKEPAVIRSSGSPLHSSSSSYRDPVANDRLTWGWIWARTPSRLHQARRRDRAINSQTSRDLTDPTANTSLTCSLLCHLQPGSSNFSSCNASPPIR